MGNLCGKKSRDEGDEDDEAELRKKKKKYEKEPGASWGAGDVLSESDAGPVEICLSKLYTEDAQKQQGNAGIATDMALTATLYHKRTGAGGNQAWNLIAKHHCVPPVKYQGEMVAVFGDRAVRELSRHKAPLFQMHERIEPTTVLHLVVAHGGAGAGAGTTLKSRAEVYEETMDGPEGAARAKEPKKAGRVIGEIKFTLKDLCSKGRVWDTHVGLGIDSKYGMVNRKTAEITLQLAPNDVTRGWLTRPRAPHGQLSFEGLLNALRQADEAGPELMKNTKGGRGREPRTSETLTHGREPRKSNDNLGFGLPREPRTSETLTRREPRRSTGDMSLGHEPKRQARHSVGDAGAGGRLPRSSAGNIVLPNNNGAYSARQPRSSTGSAGGGHLPPRSARLSDATANFGAARRASDAGLHAAGGGGGMRRAPRHSAGSVASRGHDSAFAPDTTVHIALNNSSV